MPTNAQLITGVVVSAAITIGGAWGASLVLVQRNAPNLTAISGDGLTVTVSDVRNRPGKIVVVVFDDQASFKSFNVNQAAGYRSAPARAGQVVVRFPKLKQGPYAVGALHDENGDDDLNMSGEVPQEGYATSGASDAYDTPTFRKASVASGSVKVRMHYWGKNH